MPTDALAVHEPMSRWSSIGEHHCRRSTLLAAAPARIVAPTGRESRIAATFSCSMV
jgi:hypothetical protein